MKKENSKNLNNKKIIILISILVLIIIGLVGYIAYDKKIIFISGADVENKKGGVRRKLDLTKCLNTTGVKYSNPTDKEGNYGLSMSINNNKKYVTLGIDWKTFGPLTTATAYSDENHYYQINGFTKKIKSTFVGDVGQDSMGITLFFIMEDGTVEYMPMFINKTDHYEMNYSASGNSFTVSGALPNVKDVYKFYTVNATNGSTSSGITTIGVKKDGSFYDLGVITKTGKNETKENSKEEKNHRYYLLDGIENKRRYYLAFDEIQNEGQTIDSGKKAYIMDMNFSNSNPVMKEINLSDILRPLYNEKINSIPNIISEGTTNATPKSSCTSYKMLYSDVNDPQMLDAENEIPFQVNYLCVFNGNSMIGLGTEIYYLNANNLTIRHMGSLN